MAEAVHDRIARALPAHYSQMRPYRVLRRELIRDYRGTLYPGDDSHSYLNVEQKQILPLMQQACESMVMGLAANRPRFLITPKDPGYEAFAGKMERALNRYSELIALEETLQDIVRDAFFSIGVGKVYMADSVAVGFECDYRMDPGKPYAQRVCLDNFVFDTTSSSVVQSTFFADRYRVSHDKLMKDRRFRKFHKALESYNKSQRESESEKPAHLEGIEDYVWLADVYVPYRRRVYTYVVDGAYNIVIPQPVAQMRWEGDECGPYYFLQFGTVPDEVMPSSPGQNVKLSGELANTLMRKLEDQARRQKILTVGSNSNERDLESFRDAQDGEFVPLQDPSSVQQIRLDGPDAQMHGFFIAVMEQFSRAAGNLNHRLGLSPTADSVGQEEMIGGQVGRMEGQQQQKFVSFVRRLTKGLARLLYEDGFTTIPGYDQVEGTNYKVPDVWQGKLEVGSRQGEFGDYVVDVDPYSMAYQSPQQKLGMIRQELAQFLPMLPYLGQLGVQLDIQKYFEQVERLQNLPEVRSIFKTNQPPVAPAQGGGASGATPQREYLHRSAGAAPQSADQQAAALFNSGSGGE